MRRGKAPATNEIAAAEAETVSAATAPWWSQPPDAVVDALRSSAKGLTTAEAEARLAIHGPNAPAPAKEEPWYEEVVEELAEPMILLLLAVGVFYAIFGEAEDAVTIVVVIVITILAEFATERRAGKAIAELAALQEPSAPVLRDGAIATIPVERIVPGDVIALTAGERVPADVRLLSSSALAIDESALTGESTASEKASEAAVAANAPLAERTTMAYQGTVVTRGDGLGVVVATGRTTETARIARLVAEVEPSRTPLQVEMSRLSGQLIWIAFAASIAIPLILLAFGTVSWRDALLTGLTLAFATIPEELPMLITAVLALGAIRLARRHAVVKSLAAAEALGSVSVLVSDKTGTLTENRMTVTGVVDADGTRHALNGDDELVKRAVCIGVLANDAVSSERGDPSDLAFFVAARTTGDEPDRLRASHPRQALFPFSDATRSVAARVVIDGTAAIVVKGAPEDVLARATHVRGPEGERPLAPSGCARVLELAERLAGEGYRVLAAADRRDDLPVGAPREVVEADLTFVALVTLADPVRSGARESVADLETAGVPVVLVTGDHPSTAGAVGRSLGIDGARPVTGADLPPVEGTDGSLLAGFVARHPVIARATPEDKYRIVEALERAGERVAVTGDGINDAPALARATVGVAMGMRGTDVARETADLVLADDDISTVVVAVREARHLYDNLRKAIRFYLAIKVALILTTAIPALAGQPLPFSPVQIIILELLMDLGASVSFVAEPAEGDVMRRPPRDPRRRFLDRSLGTMVLLGGVAFAGAVLGVYAWAHWSADMTDDQARTTAFVTWLIGHVVLALGFRSEREPLLRLGVFSNRVAVAWMAAAIAVAVLATTSSFVGDRLGSEPISGEAWLLAAVVPLVTTAGFEIAKWLRWRHDRRRAREARR